MANFQVVDEYRDVLAEGSEFVYVAAAVLACRRDRRYHRVLYSDGMTLAVDLDHCEVAEHLESVAEELVALVEAL